MMFLIFLTDWIKKEKLFVLSFFFFLIIKTSLLDRTLTYQPEMWAEGVTNYYLSAFTLDFWKSFLVLDFGYLPLWPRIVANFFYLFKPPSTLIPILYQSFSIVFICFSIASINLTRNNLLISSKYLRFFLSFLFLPIIWLRASYFY